MADKKLTEEIQSIVQSQDVTTEQLIQGVDILHRIAPSNMVYMRWQQLVASRPLYLKEHILAELKKHLVYRLDDLTRSEVRTLDIKVQQNVNETLTANRTGKREDHDSLPPEIQALWDDNADIYKRLKDKFEECKSLNDKPACDRYEVLKILAELDDKYRAQMKAYDSYVINADNTEGDAQQTQEDSKDERDITKEIGAARTYISKNIAKLESLVAAATITDADSAIIAKRDELQEKIRQRVAFLVENKAVMGDAITERLNNVGIGTNEEN